MTTSNLLRIVNHAGVPFTVRLVPVGGGYGRKGTLTNTTKEVLVEFYDARYLDGDFPGLGQFVSRYHASTFGVHDGADRLVRGLSLDGGVPDWVISQENVEEVRAFLAGRAPETGEPAAKYLLIAEDRNQYRLFFCPEDGGVYVGDRSGRDPDYTDSGPMRLINPGERAEVRATFGSLGVPWPARMVNGAFANIDLSINCAFEACKRFSVPLYVNGALVLLRPEEGR